MKYWQHIIHCPSCGGKQTSKYYHTEMTIIHCQNMKRDKDGKLCPSLGHYGFQFNSYNDPDYPKQQFTPEGTPILVAWEQRGAKNNQPIPYQQAPVKKKGLEAFLTEGRG